MKKPKKAIRKKISSEVGIFLTNRTAGNDKSLQNNTAGCLNMGSRIVSGLFLTLRRFLAFHIDLLIVLIVLFMTEGLIAFVLSFYSDYLNPPFPQREGLILLGDLHIFLIPTLLGVITSPSIIFRRSPGFHLAKLKISVPGTNVAQTLICILRSLFVMYIPYIIGIILCLWNLEKNHFAFPSAFDISVVVFVTILLPVSVFFGYGRQGLHDVCFNIAIKTLNMKAEVTETILNLNRIAASLIASAIIAAIIGIIGHDSIQFRKIYSNFYEMRHRTRSSLPNIKTNDLENINNSEAIKALEKNYRITWRSGARHALFLRSFKQDNRPRNIFIPNIIFGLGGFGFKNTANLMGDVEKAARKLLPNDRYIDITFECNNNLDLFNFGVKTNCFFDKLAVSPICVKELRFIRLKRTLFHEAPLS